jgi:hypothetical protein
MLPTQDRARQETARPIATTLPRQSPSKQGFPAQSFGRQYSFALNLKQHSGIGVVAHALHDDAALPETRRAAAFWVSLLGSQRLLGTTPESTAPEELDDDEELEDDEELDDDELDAPPASFTPPDELELPPLLPLDVLLAVTGASSSPVGE